MFARSNFTLITPTGDRFQAFQLCYLWFLRQTIRPSILLIIDDGQVPLTDAMKIPEEAEYVRRTPKPSDPPHTLAINLLTAIPKIMNKKILIMEDDDWYGPEYLETMVTQLNHADLLGLKTIYYYQLKSKVWKSGIQSHKTSLAQTAFTSRVISTLKEICTSGERDIQRYGVIDRFLWSRFKGKKRLFLPERLLHVGMKGLPGRPGLAEGHLADSWGYKSDKNLEKLKELLGDDVEVYSKLLKELKE